MKPRFVVMNTLARIVVFLFFSISAHSAFSQDQVANKDLEDLEFFVTTLEFDFNKGQSIDLEERATEYKQIINRVKLEEDQYSPEEMKKLATLQEKYDSLTSTIEQKKIRAKTLINLKTQLLGPNQDDIYLKGISAEELPGAFKAFINSAEAHKKSYTYEEWLEIERLYSQLQARRKTVEMKITKEGQDQINQVVRQYFTLRATYKLKQDIKYKAEDIAN